MARLEKGEMGMTDYSTVRLNKAVVVMARKYCNDYGLLLGRFIERAIKEKLKANE